MGGMQLVIHAPFGMRVNRGLGLAMRKRFCRSFDFELQAAADDNGVVLSLGPQHSFPIESMFRMINPSNIEHMLTQAMLAVPMFKIRWRWNVTRALAVRRFSNGRKVPPPLQRFRSDDSLTEVFPAQTACQENRPEDIEIPKHPLVDQTVDDCLHEAMDIVRLKEVLKGIESGSIKVSGKDTLEPSPFAHTLLNSNPYTFLDGAPLEERRARAVTTRRGVVLDYAKDLTELDPKAIDEVVRDLRTHLRGPDDVTDFLIQAGLWPGSLMTTQECGWAEELRARGILGRMALS